MKNFAVFYTYPNDEAEYRCTVAGSDADDADRRFRSGLRDDEIWEVTVTRIEEVK